MSGHDTYAYPVSIMYAHVGGGLGFLNIPGGAIESPGYTHTNYEVPTRLYLATKVLPSMYNNMKENYLDV